jgi:ribonuclease BN (tRNA processing enzyme)
MGAIDSEAGSLSGSLPGVQERGDRGQKGGDFTVRFWGVRGSYPVSRAATLGVGGNTACIEVQAGGHEIILDAGTGLIALGQGLRARLESAPPTLTILFSHLHYDHILGLPFFDPLYQPGARLTLAGPHMAGRSFSDVLCSAIAAPYFPVDLREVPANCTFYTLESGDSLCWQPGTQAPTFEPAHLAGEQGVRPGRSDEVRVTFLHSQAHPTSGCLVSRIEYGGRSLVFATDVEEAPGVDQRLIDFARGADVLVHDAQYTQEAYTAAKRGFGHSTPAMATAVARAAGVKRLVLFHHDPEYDDAVLERLQEMAQAQFSDTALAREGLELALL